MLTINFEKKNCDELHKSPEVSQTTAIYLKKQKQLFLMNILEMAPKITHRTVLFTKKEPYH